MLRHHKLRLCMIGAVLFACHHQEVAKNRLVFGDLFVKERDPGQDEDFSSIPIKSCINCDGALQYGGA